MIHPLPYLPSDVPGNDGRTALPADTSGPSDSRDLKHLLPSVLLVSALTFYTILFCQVWGERWFSPLYATDDAQQQTFLLHEALHPGSFSGDFVYEGMRAYVPLLHRIISEKITLLTQSPLLTGNIVGALQGSLTALFLFLAVRAFSGSALPGVFAVLWLLHSFRLIDSFIGGLPRGWAGAMCGAFLWLVATRSYRAILFLLVGGIFLHPHSTFWCGITYGGCILFDYFTKKTNAQRNLIQAAIAFPFIVFLAIFSQQKPPWIGKMTSYAEAVANPAFSRKGGRFQFLPFRAPSEEITRYGSYSFGAAPAGGPRAHSETRIWEVVTRWSTIGLLSLVLIGSVFLRRELIAPPLIFGIFSAVAAYFLARAVAFQLFVPDRYLIWPFNLSAITSLSVVGWRLFSPSKPYRSLLVFIPLSALLLYTGGSGLRISPAFNIRTNEDQRLYGFIKTRTPETARFAGHPLSVNRIPLLGARRVFISEEVAHPFFDTYYAESLRRAEVSLRAHYAENVEQFLAVLANDDIDYFVFFSRNFDRCGKSLCSNRYHRPLDKLSLELATGRELDRYFYTTVRNHLECLGQEVVPFSDSSTVVVHIPSLRAKLAAGALSECFNVK